MNPQQKFKPSVAMVTRRTALGWAGASLAAPGGVAAAAPTDTVTVLYKRDSNDARLRTDPAVLAGTLALEGEFARRGFRVVQPAAQVYEVLDKGPAVAVTFAADAGFSLLYSAFSILRPMPGTDKGVTEVILRCRVFVGHSLLAAEEGRGMMATSTAADVREFAERRSAEQAAQRAAAALAEKVTSRLKELSPADVERMATATLPPAPAFQAIAVPAQPSVGASTSATALPPPARKFALVVGVSDYAAVRQRGERGVSDLRGVAVDRTNLASALRDIGFQPENITVLADSQATSAIDPASTNLNQAA
jgi:hypothetical protein